jgi:hypothetical protein
VFRVGRRHVAPERVGIDEAGLAGPSRVRPAATVTASARPGKPAGHAAGFDQRRGGGTSGLLDGSRDLSNLLGSGGRPAGCLAARLASLGADRKFNPVLRNYLIRDELIPSRDFRRAVA